jgi:hypothetical protein
MMMNPGMVLFWQLESIFREETSDLRSVLQLPHWAKYLDWHTRFDTLVDVQDRSVLDAMIPLELARAVFARSKRKYCESGDSLYAAHDDRVQADPNRRVLTALDAFEKYGGAVLEEVLEKTSCKVR